LVYSRIFEKAFRKTAQSSKEAALTPHPPAPSPLSNLRGEKERKFTIERLKLPLSNWRGGWGVREE
jgi:hypothetical protein